MTKLLVIGATLAVCALLIAALASGGQGPALEPGAMAPDFALEASDGETYRLADLKGTTVVLAWFPKAFTGG